MVYCFLHITHIVNTLRPRQNGRHFADDTFKRIFLNANVIISFKISLKFVPKGRINIIPALVRIMAWRRPGDKPLSDPMMVSLLTHICVTRPKWVKSMKPGHEYMRWWTGLSLHMVEENGLSPRNYFDQCWLVVTCLFKTLTSVIFESQYKRIISRKYSCKYCLQNISHSKLILA